MAKRLTENEKALIIELYKAGKPARKIAAFIHCGESTVYQLLRDKGITPHFPDRSENARVRWENIETRDKKQIEFDEIVNSIDDNDDGLNLPPYEYKGESIGKVTKTAISSNGREVAFTVKKHVPAGESSSGFNWITKGRGNDTAATIGNVAINASSAKNKNVYQQIYFTFYNECWRKFGQTGFFVFAVADDRIYFKSENAVSGYKLTTAKSKQNQTTRYMACKTTDEIHALFESRKGVYNLKYDSNVKLHYIDISKGV